MDLTRYHAKHIAHLLSLRATDGVDRIAQSLEASCFALATWLRLAEEKAVQVATRPYDVVKLSEAVDQIRSLTREDPEVFLPEVTGARVSGATHWLSPTKAMVAQSLRHKTDDHFWFTLFHELGHVTLHGKKSVFVDQPDGVESQEEQEANRFARDHLVPRKRYADFVSHGSFYPDEIAEFAADLEIAPGVVAGMLQHDGKLPDKWGNGLKRRLELESNIERCDASDKDDQ